MSAQTRARCRTTCVTTPRRLSKVSKLPTELTTQQLLFKTCCRRTQILAVTIAGPHDLLVSAIAACLTLRSPLSRLVVHSLQTTRGEAVSLGQNQHTASFTKPHLPLRRAPSFVAKRLPPAPDERGAAAAALGPVSSLSKAQGRAFAGLALARTCRRLRAP